LLAKSRLVGNRSKSRSRWSPRRSTRLDQWGRADRTRPSGHDLDRGNFSTLFPAWWQILPGGRCPSW